MKTHQPDIITRKLGDGKWFSQCIACMEHSRPSMHKPIAEGWRKSHTKAALAGERRPA